MLEKDNIFDIKILRECLEAEKAATKQDGLEEIIINDIDICKKIAVFCQSQLTEEVLTVFGTLISFDVIVEFFNENDNLLSGKLREKARLCCRMLLANVNNYLEENHKQITGFVAEKTTIDNNTINKKTLH